MSFVPSLLSVPSCICCNRCPSDVKNECERREMAGLPFIKECPSCFEVKCILCWGGCDGYIPDIAENEEFLQECQSCWIVKTLDISHSFRCCFEYTKNKIRNALLPKPT